jgi:hypothetical protein
MQCSSCGRVANIICMWACVNPAAVVGLPTLHACRHASCSSWAGLPTLHACGHVRHSNCDGVANFVCMWVCATWWLWQGCQLCVCVDMHDTAAVVGLLTWCAQCSSCGRVTNFVCMWTYATLVAVAGLLTSYVCVCVQCGRIADLVCATRQQWQGC